MVSFPRGCWWLVHLTLICHSLTANSWAQLPAEYTVTHYTDENGLPQNSVNAIAQDSKGFLWLATESGLVRFDGQSFFTYDRSVLNMASNRIRYFLPRSGQPGSSEPLFYSCDGLRGYLGIYQDSYARPAKVCLWQTVKDTISRTLGAKAHYLVSLPDVFGPAQVDTLAGMDLGFLPVDHGRYYMRRNGYIELYESGKRAFSTYFPQNRKLFHHDGRLFAVQQDGNLFAVDGQGAHRIELAGSILNNVSYKRQKSKLSYFYNNISQQVFANLDGYLYQVQFNGQIAQTRLLARGIDLDRLGVISLYVDRSRNIFLGCVTDGLYVLKPKRFITLAPPDDPSRGVFYAVAPAGTGSIITRQGYLFDLDKGKPFAGQPARKLGRGWEWYFLVKDKQGTLWVSESTSPSDRRLARYSADGKTLLGSWDVPGVVEGIYSDPSGTIWFQTSQGRLYYLNSGARPDSNPVFFADLAGYGIQTFHRSGSNQLWFGSSKGLHVLDLPGRRLVPVSALAGKNVRHIYGQGSLLWICTDGDGLYLYKDRKVVQFPIDSDRFFSSAHCLVPDSLGHFWVPTNKGLFEIGRADLLDYAAGKSKSVFYRYFDKQNGFNTNEFNGGCQPCGVALRSGNITFPSLNGIVYFNPHKLGEAFPDGGMIVKNIFVDGRAVRFDGEVLVPRSFEQLQVSVSTPYMGNPRNVRFSYQLVGEGSHGSWLPVADGERIYLAGLLPGTYTLRVRKTNGFGTNNFSYLNLIIVVPPYWYETNWFAAVLVVVTAILISCFLRAWTRYTRQRRYNENLLSKARLYGDIITSINHDIQTPLHYVLYSVEQLTRFVSTHEQAGTAYTKLGTETLSSLQRISALTNNLLHFLRANIYHHNYSIIIAPVPLAPLTSEIVEMFSAKTIRDKITVVNLVPAGAEYALNAQLFSVILHNILDNAVKVSKGGTVKLSVDQAGGLHYLRITDSGPGMPADVAVWLMSTGQASMPIAADRAGRDTMHTGGLGLIIVRDLCRLSQIKLLVKSKQGEGTTLLLALKPAT